LRFSHKIPGWMWKGAASFEEDGAKASPPPGTHQK
jgi:hypothetical protein